MKELKELKCPKCQRDLGYSTMKRIRRTTVKKKKSEKNRLLCSVELSWERLALKLFKITLQGQITFFK